MFKLQPCFGQEGHFCTGIVVVVVMAQGMKLRRDGIAEELSGSMAIGLGKERQDYS